MRAGKFSRCSDTVDEIAQVCRTPAGTFCMETRAGARGLPTDQAEGGSVEGKGLRAEIEGDRCRLPRPVFDGQGRATGFPANPKQIPRTCPPFVFPKKEIP